MEQQSNKKSIIIAIIVTFLLTFALASFLFWHFAVEIVARTQPFLASEYDNKTTALEFSDNDVEKVLELQNFIEKNYYINTDEVDFTAGVYKGLFESLDDPYSVYMTKDEFKRFNESSSGTYGGIGVVVTAAKDNFITVVSPIEDTPGERAGLKTGDKIIAVNGEEVYADGMSEAIKIMKGEPGTDVTLTIYREGEDKFDVTITRELIVLKSVKSRLLADDIGYIRISSFDQKVFDEFKTHYEELQAKGIKGLIIDLRNNPGGDLAQCVQLSDYILGKQLIVYTENNAGERREFKSDTSKIDLPLVVLVNGGSASASEILTGAVKDSKAGTIIGTTTFGKGLVQSVYPLPDGSGVKLTTAQYFTPNGTYIHGKGIEPDKVLELNKDYDEKDDSTDNQLQAAIKVLTEQ